MAGSTELSAIDQSHDKFVAVVRGEAVSDKVFELDDGTIVTAQDVALKVGICVTSARKRLAKSSDPAVVYAQPDNYRGKAKVYRRDGMALTAIDVQRKVPSIKLATAVHRVRAWERGELTIDQLFLRKGKRMHGGDTQNRGNAEWQALSDRPREMAIYKIKGIGRWEKQQLRREMGE